MISWQHILFFLWGLWPLYGHITQGVVPGPPASETPRVLKKAGPRPDSTLGLQSPGQQLLSRCRSRAELEAGVGGLLGRLLSPCTWPVLVEEAFRPAL